MSPESSADDDRPPAAFPAGTATERPGAVSATGDEHAQGRAHFQAQLRELEAKS